MKKQLCKYLIFLSLFLRITASYADQSSKYSQILESQLELKRSLETIQKQNLLLIPFKIKDEWITVPIPKADLEPLINIWMIGENGSIEQAIANAQAIIDFTLNYQLVLEDKIKEYSKQMDAALSEEESKKKSTAFKPGPQSKTKASVTLSIDNVHSTTRQGLKKWDFDWVLTEHSGVGVTLTAYELYLSTHAPGSEKVIKDAINLRIDGGHVFRGPGFMTVETSASDKDEKNLHAQMHAIYYGQDDNGNDIVIENYFFQ